MKKICILDYGLGNIESLSNSLKKIGYKPEFYSEKKSLNYEVIFIPGVGSFSKASKLLKSAEINNFLNNAKKNSYIFGICLGMQVLLSAGFENGKSDGLNFISGSVKLLENNRKKTILPHVGYKSIKISQNNIKFLKDYDNEKFYFVHSYAAFPDSSSNIFCYSTSQKIEYCSGVYKERIIGTQFHPEKSGKIGLNFLNDFIKYS